MNRDKKRVRGGAGDGGGWDGADYSEHALHWSQQQQQGQAGPQGQQGSHEQQAGGEGGRGAQQTAGQAGAGDSWVWQVGPRNHCDLNKFDNFVIPDKFITVAVNISNILLSNNIHHRIKPTALLIKLVELVRICDNDGKSGAKRPNND